MVHVELLPLRSGALALPAFLLSLVGLAGFGHLINDWGDLGEDRRAGKPSPLAELSTAARLLWALALVVLSFAPLALIARGFFPLALAGLEILLFVAYSLKPLRVKERGGLAILNDALYGHTVPGLLAVSVLAPPMRSFTPWMSRFLALVLLWKLVQGLSGALLSQIEDRANDRRSGHRTFVLDFGPRRALLLVNQVLLPVHFLSAFFLYAHLWRLNRGVLLTFLGYLVLTLWKVHGRWRKPLSIYRRRYLGYELLNDFDEKLLPLVCLAGLMVSMPGYALVLVVHLAVFWTPTKALARQLLLLR